MSITVLLLIVVLGAGGAPRRAAAVPTAPSEVAAMQTIAKSIGADKALGWGAKSADPCGGTWAGVRCDGAASHVTSISATRAGLVGHLAGSDWSGLASLSELDLSFNRLSGDLPFLPSPLRRLTTLDLRSNVFLDIPDGFFAGLPALETFSLDDNEVIMGKISRRRGRRGVPRQRHPLPALESLSLARNQLCCAISDLFGQNSKIRFLDVSGQVHDADKLTLASPVRFLAGITNLVEVHMGENDLYAGRLRACEPQGGGACAARRLAALPTDPSDAAAMQAIARSTRADEALGWGARSADPCGGTWAGVGCNSMGRVTSINASRGGLVASLNGTDLSKLASLSDLDLSFNRLDGDLPVLPAPLPRLLSLDLRSNSFYSIPDGFFAGFPALQSFAFDDNALLIKDIPNDVVTCSNLRSFTANNASIYGTFPDYFGNATLFPRLERLSLARNRLTGPIRDGFGKKSSIKYLDVGGQRDIHGGGESSLDSRIDLFIPDMESLVEARLDHNAFTGPVPDATRLVNLRVFDASYNNLCGVPMFADAGRVAANFDGNPSIGTECSR
uniref:Leucine-rich repeat-containing N-terminal plant-type domain-containing protein n=1 Tax=Oryza meridionalis TaxID=40149 RepID=A0A0E0D4W7_9ORYZ